MLDASSSFVTQTISDL